MFSRLIILLLLLGNPSCLLAERFTLPATADTSILEAKPDLNLGKSRRLRLGTGAVSGRARGLVKFDVSSIPTASKVVYATVKVTTEYPPGGHLLCSLSLFRLLRDWNEGKNANELEEVELGSGATWWAAKNPDDLWLESGAEYMTDYYYLSSASVTPDYRAVNVGYFTGMGLASDVQAWIDRGQENYGWLIYVPCENGLDSSLTIASREDPQNAPELIVFTGNLDAPRVFVNGQFADGSETVFVDTSGQLTIESPFPSGRIFCTLDGSPPTVGSFRYTKPLEVRPGYIVRAVTYNADYSQGGVESAPLTIELLPRYSLNLSVPSGGSIQINNSGLIPGPFSGPHPFTSNTVVTLRAWPLSGWAFTGWTGDLTTSEPKLVVTMTHPIELRANFAPIAGLAKLTARRIEGEWIVLQFESHPSLNYVVQSSTDLRDWVDGQRYSKSSGVVDDIVPFESATKTRFYRVASTIAPP